MNNGFVRMQNSIKSHQSRNPNDDTPEFTSFLRLCSGVLGVILLVISTKFNADGFGFKMEDTGDAWFILIAAYTMAFTVTLIEMIGSKPGVFSPTFIILWLASYVYGVSATAYGILRAQSYSSFAEVGDGWWFPVSVAVLFEIAPELLIVWALYGKMPGHDLINTIVGWFSRGNPLQSYSVNMQRNPQNEYNRSMPNYRGNQGQGRNQPQYDVRNNGGAHRPPIRKPQPQPHPQRQGQHGIPSGAYSITEPVQGEIPMSDFVGMDGFEEIPDIPVTRGRMEGEGLF